MNIQEIYKELNKKLGLANSQFLNDVWKSRARAHGRGQGLRQCDMQLLLLLLRDAPLDKVLQ